MPKQAALWGLCTRARLLPLTAHRISHNSPSQVAPVPLSQPSSKSILPEPSFPHLKKWGSKSHLPHTKVERIITFFMCNSPCPWMKIKYLKKPLNSEAHCLCPSVSLPVPLATVFLHFPVLGLDPWLCVPGGHWYSPFTDFSRISNF